MLYIASYAWLAFLDTGHGALQPLFFATPVRLRRLGMSPATIGSCLGIFEPLDVAVQGSVFPELLRRLRLKGFFLTCMLCFIPLVTILPVVNHFVREWGLSPVVWASIVLQFMINCVTDMAAGGYPSLNSCNIIVSSCCICPACTFLYVAFSTLSGRFLGLDKPRHCSLEQWDHGFPHPCFHTRYSIICWAGLEFTLFLS